MRQEGRITTWKDEQGYGFITPGNGGPRAFVHIKAFQDGKIRPAENDRVSYELGADQHGRPQAKYVKREGAAFRARATNKTETAVCAAPLLFLGTVGFLAGAGRLHPAVVGLYVTASFVAFLAYRSDKRAAQEDRWRTPESTLLLFGLIGGWPGALLAQRLLRHKSSKPSFQLAFWITVLINVGALGWALSPQGSSQLQQVLDYLVTGR